MTGESVLLLPKSDSGEDLKNKLRRLFLFQYLFFEVKKEKEVQEEEWEEEEEEKKKMRKKRGWWSGEGEGAAVP